MEDTASQDPRTDYSPSLEFGSYAGQPRNLKWREVERRELDWASRSL